MAPELSTPIDSASATTPHAQPLEPSSFPALYSADMEHSSCWLRMSFSRLSFPFHLMFPPFFEAESGGACAAEGVDEDFVDPWSVNAAADTGIDYDKLISE